MFIEETEEPVVETTENVEEQTTEENVEVEEEPTEEIPIKTYTEEEFNARLDELLAKKISRNERKIRKEYDAKYGELFNVLKAGTGEEDINTIKDSFKEFYTSKGVEIPSMSLNEYDLERLGTDDALDIIEEGYDTIVSEVDRLANIGQENLSTRERQTFIRLAEERKKIEEAKELASIGIGKEEIENEEFKEFNKKLNPNLSLKERYEIYIENKPKKEIEQMGSMKNNIPNKVKDYYSMEEISRLSEEDLDNPEIWEIVRKSMTKSS